MKKGEFEQIEKLVVWLREVETVLSRTHSVSMTIDSGIGVSALELYAEKLKAELKELGYEN